MKGGGDACRVGKPILVRATTVKKKNLRRSHLKDPGNHIISLEKR